MLIYKEIVSKDNITLAYFEVVDKFDKTLKSFRYSGIDAKKINDFDFYSKDLIGVARRELLEFREPDTALKIKIPKKNKPEDRTVFIHTVKERVKNQAIYRVIEPIFDKYFSNFLYSYRQSHPHYEAIKSAAKRYRREKDTDYILIGDISNYSDNMDKAILRKKIKEIGLGNQTEKLLDLYIDNTYSEKGVVICPKVGVITGLPVTVLFNNLYLDEIDKYIGKKVSLYRRVGDDFIIFDKSLTKIEEINKYLSEKLVTLMIPKNQQKISILKANTPFKFLGYKFSDGKISINDSSLRKILIRWKNKLKYYPISTKIKLRRLKKILFEQDPIHNDFIEIINQYNQTNDIEQIKKMSNYFYRKLTIYFFGKYSKRNQRLVAELTANLNIPSFLGYYKKIHTGRQSLSEIRESKKVRSAPENETL